MPLKKQFLKSRPVVKVTFEIPPEAAADAKAVYLLCEAQGWQKEPLKRLKNGSFKTVLELPTDQQDDFEFRYCLLDKHGHEHYDNDWQADTYRPSALGVENSVVSVRS